MSIKKISAALIAAAMFTATMPISVSAEDNGGLVEDDGGLVEGGDGGLTEGGDGDNVFDPISKLEAWTDSQGNNWKGKFHTLDIESQYSITVDKVVVNGAEKAAVKISGLPSRMLDTNYERDDYRYDDHDSIGSDGSYSILRRDLSWLNITIDIGERYLSFATNDVNKDFKGAVVTAVPYSLEYEDTLYRSAYFSIAGNILFDPDELPDEYPEDYPDNYKQTIIEENQDRLDRANAQFFNVEMKRNGDTFELIGYFDVDDETVKELVSAKETTVATCAFVIEHCVGVYDADGNKIPAGGASPFYLQFTSDKKMIGVHLVDAYDSELGPIYNGNSDFNSLVYGIDIDNVAGEIFGEWEDDVHKEFVKITNNLNNAAENPSTPDDTSTSDTPTTSTPSTSTPENEFKPTLPDTNLDGETKRVLVGITATASNGTFDDGVVMNIKPGQTTNGFSFDITFTKNGSEVQPKSSVTIKVPVPEALKGKTIFVFHVEDGKFVSISSEVKDGFVVFSASHFSEYVLSAENLADNAGLVEDSESTSAPESKPTAPENSNPSTGVTVAAIPVLLAAGAAVVVISKKRK